MTYMTIMFSNGEAMSEWVSDDTVLRCANAWILALLTLRLEGYTQLMVEHIAMSPDDYQANTWTYSRDRYHLQLPEPNL
jgi:hypothetical protein